MDKQQFDEMQAYKRDKIGNQMFSLLVFMLLLNTVLFDLGIHWIAYPTCDFIIVLICCGIYNVRAALSDALVAPKQKTGRFAVIMLTVAVLSMVAALGFVKLSDMNGLPETGIGSGTGAILLQVISVGSLAVTFVVYLIRRRRGNGGDN